MKPITRYKNIFHRLLAIVTVVTTAMLAPFAGRAFPADTYATASRLSAGHWVKISINYTGLYMIPNAKLSEWGFNDPGAVRVYGYGGRRLSDRLSLEEYIDDLPPVQTVVTPAGIVFYASGIDKWEFTSLNRWTHSINPFSTVGYYFLTADGSQKPAIQKSGRAGASSPVTTFMDYRCHETESTKLGETGHLLVGEDFKWTNSRTFNFSLTDIVTSEPVSMACQFVARTLSSPSTVSFSANGTSLPFGNNDRIRASSAGGYSYGEMTNTVKLFNVGSPSLSLGVSYASSGTVQSANLDFIEIGYTRKLQLSGGQLRFDLNSTQAFLGGATSATRVWDVTNPRNIVEMNTSAVAGGVSWTNDYTGMRNYVAWNEGTALPAPVYVETVKNQNLHATGEYPEMVIFTLHQWADQAERIAALHRDPNGDNMVVKIVEPAQVYNEFGSGCPDVNTFRRYLKMLYDRGNEGGKPLKYALFMGKPIYDNRRLSASAQTITYPTLPTWQSESSLDNNISYTTDDIFAFLDDDSGVNFGTDRLSIAVGRMPVRSREEAKTAVDKLYEYVNNSKRSSWRNQVLLLADDENNGVHMEQSDAMWNEMMNNGTGDQFCYTKVYIDAFEKRNSTYPEARERMYRRLDEGLMWWNYIGHANPTSWTNEGMLTYHDINNLYIRQYPILYAATCQFLNWDSGQASGAEIMYFTRYGGIIGAITAVRPVYISDNGLLSRAMGQMAFKRDENGNYMTLGEIYRRGKNNLLDSKGNPLNNTNKLRFVLMGDPAMRIITPSNRVVLEKINGEDVDIESQLTIKARETVELEGYVCDINGKHISDFNGDITLDLYDAEMSTVSRGNGDGGKKYVFDEQGEKLFTGRDHVTNGRFKMRVAMPETVQNNFRPAAINMYASSADGKIDASGVCRDFYVYGFEDNPEVDNEAPVISSAYLNHPTFKDGGTVNPTPMLIATVSDNMGFNLATLGVGHTMTLQVDGNRTFNNVSRYFTPDVGSTSGTINYPIDELAPGNHTLRLRIWDTAGNVAEKYIECFVQENARPTIYEIYADANPASVETNFYLVHDRPDMMMTVTIEVFNLLGQPVWSSSKTGRSDMFTSTPITWNLCDMAGRRVKRGIYLYRAAITESDGEQYVTKSSRIAVASPQ